MYMFLEADDTLFRKLLYNKTHVYHSYLPDRTEIVYLLPTRSHDKSLICGTSDLNDHNFLVGAIYKDCYQFLSTTVTFLSILLHCKHCCMC